MESSFKTWVRRLLVVVPVVCLTTSVALWKHDIQTVKRELIQVQQQLKAVSERASSGKREKRTYEHTGGGAVYVHWGREDCPSTADVVYTGIAGGGLTSHTGAAVNMLCMTHTPVWGRYGDDAVHYTYLYGTEYQVITNDFPLGHGRAEALRDHDVPSTVCRSSTRSSVIMIPGTTVCEAGWQMEYSGYLMAGHYSHAAATEYNCIDSNPDAHESGAASEADTSYTE